MRRAARTDSNHRAIVCGLRDAGRCVFDTSRVGNGFPDLIAGTRASGLVFLEVKDGSKPPSARKLTPAETSFMSVCHAHGLPYHVVTSLEEALKAT